MENTSEKVSFIEKNRHWFIFCSMSFAGLLVNFHQMGLATISSEVAQSLRADASHLGALVAAYSYSYAAMQIPVGLLVDTLGARKTVTAGLLIAAIGTFIFALAPSVSIAIVGRVLVGLGTSTIYVPLLKLLAVWFPLRYFGHLTAVAFGVGALGALVATSPLAYVIQYYDWESVHIFLAFLTLGTAVLVFAVIRDRKEGAEPPLKREYYIQQFKKLFGSVVVHRSAWFLGIWYFCQAGAYFAFIGLWAGQFLTKAMEISITDASLILTLPACVLIISPLFTWLASKFASYKMLFGLSFLSTVFAIPLAVGFPTLPFFVLTLYLIVYGMLTINGAAVVFDTASRLFSVEYAGTLAGFINMFPILGSAVLQQSIGIYLDYNLKSASTPYEAFTQSFIILPIVSVISLVMIIAFIREARRLKPIPE